MAKCVMCTGSERGAPKDEQRQARAKEGQNSRHVVNEPQPYSGVCTSICFKGVFSGSNIKGGRRASFPDFILP